MTMSSRAERSKRIIFDDKLEETANDENLKLLQNIK